MTGPATGPSVQLVPLSAAGDPALLRAVLALRPAPGQERYCLPAAVTHPPASADPLRVAFAVTEGGAPVGFGTLDRRGQLEQLLDDPARGLLLRAFFIAEGHQGRGLGTAAARAARRLAARLEPSADLLVLCVHTSNAPARAAYARAGFADTGARWLAQAGDPQVVMAAALRPPGARAAQRDAAGRR